MEPFRVENNWESITVWLGNAKVEPEKSYLVQFPDGTERIIRFEWHKRIKSYGDMGHTYSASSLVPSFLADYRGMKLRIHFQEFQQLKGREMQ